MQRPRRNRKSEPVRALTQETHLHVEQLIEPLFIVDGKNQQVPIAAMPGIYRYSIDKALLEIEQCMELGIKSFILFPVVDDKLKDKEATISYKEDNFYLQAISTIKKKFPPTQESGQAGICIVTDVAMDPYSSDGHDGLVSSNGYPGEDGEILNDETLPILAKMAVAQAKAGADIIGPSDMMDGRVGYIRDAMDKGGYTNVSIMSYTAKYASAFYEPFREALDSAPKGDKKTYQMNPANQQEALLEAELDFEQGADFLMVKPALPYLDVIKLLKDNFPIPIVGYNTSGEYAMIKAAAQNNWLDGQKAMVETLQSIRRAGADIIITYFAKEYAEIQLKRKN